MLYKSTVLFVALFASSVVAAPIPGEKFTRAAVAGGCNATAVQANLAQMKDVANNILSVGSPLPDPFRANDADAAAFDTVVSAIADAGTAAAAGDFNTTASKVSFVNNAVSGLLDGKVADGLESSIDRTLPTWQTKPTHCCLRVLLLAPPLNLLLLSQARPPILEL
ncbi:hypothetical protein FB451DRAFT_130000 [Mycena latifolia]|nr:hypothetical protein FB451DRAFT_130000 [Mycena latifolia]